MSAETIGAVASVAAVIVTILGGMIVLIYNAGRHAQRLDTHEADIKSLKDTTAEHSKAIGVWDQALQLLQEVREDVKGLLMGAHQDRTSRRRGPTNP